MIFERVQKVIAEQLNVEKKEVQLNAVLTTDLGANSLDLVNLILGFEEEFKITIPEDDIPKFITVNDIIVYLEKSLT